MLVAEREETGAMTRSTTERELGPKDRERIQRLTALLLRAIEPPEPDIRPSLDSHLNLWESCSTDATVSAVELGRRGGRANKGKTGIVKGFAAMSPEDRRAIQEKAWSARRKKKSKDSA
jgi:hypothetical protein